MRIPFAKMQGAGNDYIYVSGRETELADPGAAAARLSDRHFGVGSDGLVMILPSDIADARMRMWNADGSESPMCGNAIRCVAKYVWERGVARRNPLRIETAAGVKTLRLTVEDGRVTSSRVDMGEPRLEPSALPALFPGERAVDVPLEAAGHVWRVTCVSVGNPHAVVFAENVAALPLAELGPLFERHSLFPERVNTEFVERTPEGFFVRVWERGSGETLACGTGASAVGVACVLRGLARRDEEIPIRLTGGTLRVTWSSGGSVFLKGPAEWVFDGVAEL